MKLEGKYDYSKFVYINAATKGIIICPEHGEFLQTPQHHINRGQGCPKCYRRFTILNEIINLSNIKYNNKYDFSKFVYVNARTKGIIICPVHGEFLQTVQNHLKGSGCARCIRRSTTTIFIKKAKTVHGNIFDYSKFVYVDSVTKGIIICPVHGEFLCSPSYHLRGKGCSKCFIRKNKRE